PWPGARRDRARGPPLRSTIRNAKMDTGRRRPSAEHLGGRNPRQREGGSMRTTNSRGWLRGLATAVGALLVGIACGTTQGTTSGPAKNDPGVTASEVLIGSTFPLSGAASAYAAIQRGETAYFASLNDQGGVNGRKITYRV